MIVWWIIKGMVESTTVLCNTLNLIEKSLWWTCEFIESSESQSKAVPSINKKLNFMFTKLACRVAFFSDKTSHVNVILDLNWPSRLQNRGSCQKRERGKLRRYHVQEDGFESQSKGQFSCWIERHTSVTMICWCVLVCRLIEKPYACAKNNLHHKTRLPGQSQLCWQQCWAV